MSDTFTVVPRQNLRTARQTDEFALDGGPAVLEPRFTIHGSRYAEITGYPGALYAGDIVARVAHSDIAPAGSFRSSSQWLDRLFRTIDWGQRGNFISVPTDCPQRDERLGWLGDAQIFARTACYNRDVAAFFSKWLDGATTIWERWDGWTAERGFQSATRHPRPLSAVRCRGAGRCWG